MNKYDLKTTVDFVLSGMDEHTLRMLLEHKTETIYYLVTLKNRMRKNPIAFGICAAIINTHLVAALSPTWKHYSGNSMFPVPGRKNRDPEAVYSVDYPNETKWIGQQKRYRFSLIDHLLKNASTFYKAVENRLK